MTSQKGKVMRYLNQSQSAKASKEAKEFIELGAYITLELFKIATGISPERSGRLDAGTDGVMIAFKWSLLTPHQSQAAKNFLDSLGGISDA